VIRWIVAVTVAQYDPRAKVFVMIMIMIMIMIMASLRSGMGLAVNPTVS
jgi:hypothetical protein